MRHFAFAKRFKCIARTRGLVFGLFQCANIKKGKGNSFIFPPSACPLLYPLRVKIFRQYIRDYDERPKTVADEDSGSSEAEAIELAAELLQEFDRERDSKRE